MTLILTMVLAIAGLAAILQGVNHISRCNYYARGNLLLIDIVVTVLYLLLIGLVALFVIYSGYDLTVSDLNKANVDEVVAAGAKAAHSQPPAVAARDLRSV